MGGTGFSVRVSATPKATSGEELVGAVCQAAISYIEKHATRDEDDQVTADYVLSVAEDSRLDGDDLSFTFMDGAGLCNMSHRACMHWFELALTQIPLAKIVQAQGYKLAAKPKPLADALQTVPSFAYLAGTLVACQRYEGEISLEGDDGYDIPPLSSLTASEQRRVTALVDTRSCECSLCEMLGKPPRAKARSVP